MTALPPGRERTEAPGLGLYNQPPAPPADPGWFPLVRLVARREIIIRMRSKAYLLTTAALIASVLAAVVITKVVGTDPETVTVGVTPSASALATPLEAVGEATGTAIETKPVDAADAEQLLRDGDVAAVLTGPATDARVLVEGEPPTGLAQTLDALAQRQALAAELTALGGDPAVVAQRVAAATIPITSLEPPDLDQGYRAALGFFLGIILYLALMLYGQQVASGVIEEKTSRVVELLLATIRPWHLMAGKVTGIGIVGVVQLAAVAVVGCTAALGSGALDLAASAAVGPVVWGIVWFLVGFATYALLFAAAGAMVSRQEDVGSVTSPMMGLLVVPYLIGALTLPTDPDNQLATILSIVPLTSPILMPWRIALGAPAWQAWLSLALSLALIPVLVALCARVYRNSVLRTGARVRLRDAFRSQ